MKHGSGVARAISDKGGPIIKEESLKYIKDNGEIKVGQCAVTGSGDLACKHIIHTVGPRWNDKITTFSNASILHTAVYNTLVRANQLGCKSVSIPAISSGKFKFPKPLCAKVTFRALK